MIKVAVTSVGKNFKKLEPEIASILKKLLILTKKGNFPASLFLVDNLTMRKLNRTHRGENKTTNVLSFRASKGFIMPPKSPKVLGEIYLAPDYIKKHNEDIVYLLIHGLLHLLGFDHKGKSDTISMQLKEKKLLKQLRT